MRIAILLESQEGLTWSALLDVAESAHTDAEAILASRSVAVQKVEVESKAIKASRTH